MGLCTVYIGVIRVMGNQQSFVFIGFMGAGKTTVGKLVAEKLEREFIDIDEAIEKEYGIPTTEIFKKIGEKAFRAKEKEIIIELSKKPGYVLSLGGGAFLQEETREACLQNCTVIFLDISWEYWRERIGLLMDSRPVLQGRNQEEIRELFNSRQAIYQHHHIKIGTDHQQPEQIAEYIVSKLG